MNVVYADWVAGEAQRILGMAGEPEGFHGAEDELYLTVLRAIRDGYCDDPQACAAALSPLMESDAMRWYA